MKVGDLVRVRGTSIAQPDVEELWRTGDPCLVAEIAHPFLPTPYGIPVRGPWVKIVTIQGGKELTVRFGILEVIET